MTCATVMHKWLRIWQYLYMSQVNMDELEPAAEMFRGLGAPGRLAILRRLDEEPASVGDLARQLGMSQPLVSQHLRVLRQLKLVDSSRHGQRHIYSLVDEHVAHIVNDAITHTLETS